MKNKDEKEKLHRLKRAAARSKERRQAKEDARDAKWAEKKELYKKNNKGKGLKDFYRRHLHSFIGISFVMALIIVLITELLARKNLIDCLEFVFLHPLVFLVNVFLVFATVSLAMLFRRKTFMFSMLSAAWLVLGIINGIILGQRMTPFTTSDLAELRDGLSLASTYFSRLQIVLLVIAGVVVAFTIVLLFLKLPKEREKIDFKRAIPTYLAILVISIGSLVGGVQTGVLDTFFPNLAYGYRDNGFNYCFLATWLDKGISKPQGYSAKQITDIFTDEELNTSVPGRMTEGEGNEDRQKPNILVVQLESFMDPQSIKDIELSKDAIPNFRALSKRCSSGKLQVPAMGAGTANTEFEMMSGMSTKLFGPGEYPYKTVLQDETCETLGYDLKTYGYTAHGIHDHRGAFYDRNKVYPNLGFDTFTCLEYMSGVSKTPKNWAKDAILTDQIFDALEATEGKDYVFTVSVQGHGKYPTEQLLKDPEIKVLKASNEELKHQWEYFVNQLYDMDRFVKNLVKAVDEFDEDTVVVFYGDHMPALDNIAEDNMTDGRNVFQTDYIVYSNFEMEQEDKDLYAYQLMATVLDRLDIHNGTLVSYHQNYMGKKNYMANLEKLQYDMLYGNKYIYDGTSPYIATNMKMGVKDIKVTGVRKIGEKYYIQGENFTEYSKVNLDGEILETVYLGPSLLGLREKVDPDSATRMKVSQVEKNKEILSTTE